MSNAAEKSEAQIKSLPAHGELEGLLLAGAAAIQALVAERDRLRSRVNLLEHESLRLNASNQELLRQFATIGNNCRRLAMEFDAQLQIILSAPGAARDGGAKDGRGALAEG
jgi:hypothetical protein